MSKANFDVVVVGAGPAGITAAICVAKSDFSVLVLEAGAFPGAENWSGAVHFSETLIRPDVLWLDELERGAIERRIVKRGFYIYNGHAMFGLAYRNPKTFENCYTVLRPVFDHWLAEKQRYGVCFNFHKWAQALTVIRSDRYRAKLNAPSSGDFVMNGPMIGYFANGEPQTISGYVSAKEDEDLSTETNLVSVTVNGIGATIDWNSVDTNGNVRFTTTNAIPAPDPNTYVPLIVTVTYARSNTTYNYPAGVLGPYFIARKETRYQIYPFPVVFQKLNPTDCFGLHGLPSRKGLYSFVLPVSSNYFGTYSNEYTRTIGLSFSDCCPRPCASGPDDFVAISPRLTTNAATSGETYAIRLQPQSRGLTVGKSLTRKWYQDDFNGDGTIDEELVDYFGPAGGVCLKTHFQAIKSISPLPQNAVQGKIER